SPNTNKPSKTRRNFYRRSNPKVSGDFSVQPLCSLCLCGLYARNNHRDTENTEIAQRSILIVRVYSFGESPRGFACAVRVSARPRRVCPARSVAGNPQTPGLPYYSTDEN